MGSDEQPNAAAEPSPRRLRIGAGRVAGWLRRHLSEGLPIAFVAALAAGVLVAVLYTVASRESKEPRGYAEFTLSNEGCTVDSEGRLHASFCERLGPGSYRIRFAEQLTGSTVLASRGSCCPGPIGASIVSDTEVVVAVERRLPQPVRASVFVP